MLLALIAFALVLILAFKGVPLAYSALGVGFMGIVYMKGWNAAFYVSAQWIMDSAGNYNLSIIPLFILMGAFIHRSGVSQDLFKAAYAWMGRFRGGLAMSAILSCAGFAAVCGSSLATAATMTRVAVPPMRDFKYSEGYSAGTVAAGGTLGIMIPPSVPLVIYGIIAGQDIGKLFIAGILPGLLLITLFIISVVIVTAIKPELGPKGEAKSMKETLAASTSTWPVLALFAIVLGGIYAGIFTPTEAAAVGCFGAWLFGVWRGHFRNWKSLSGALEEALKTSAMIFAILFSAFILAQFVNLTGMPFDLLNWVQSMNLGQMGLILMICAICILLGTVFESIGILVLLIPVFLPALIAMDVNLIWFGILVIVVIELGLISPPIGLNVFTVKSVATEIPLSAIFMGVSPYVVAMIIACLLLIAFPQIALTLPNMIG